MEMEMIESVAEPTAAVDVTAGAESLLERLTEAIRALELAIAQLGAKGAVVQASAPEAESRRTVPAALCNLLSKQGVSLEALGAESAQPGALDAALASLSLEQRIAVKGQLLRAGVLGK